MKHVWLLKYDYHYNFGAGIKFEQEQRVFLTDTNNPVEFAKDFENQLVKINSNSEVQLRSVTYIGRTR